MPILKIAFILFFLLNICYAHLPNPHAIEKKLQEYKEKSVASNLSADNINITANNKATVEGRNYTPGVEYPLFFAYCHRINPQS